jgi:hypothetical protein
LEANYLNNTGSTSKKKVLIILVTAVLTAGLAGGGVYYFLNKQAKTDKNNLQKQIDDLKKVTKTVDTTITAIDTPAPTPVAVVTPTPVVDVTADWKNFKDNTHSLSFKYPATWKIKSSEDFKKNDEEMVYVDQSVTILDDGTAVENSNNGLLYTHMTNIADYGNTVEAYNKDIAEILAVYNNKKVGTNTGAENINLPSSNAPTIASSEPEYIESKDGTFRGIVYFPNIGQGYGTGLDCVIIMTNGKKIFKLHSFDESVKTDYFKNKGMFSDSSSVADPITKEFQAYVKALTSKNIEETVIKNYNDIYKNIALSLN